MSDCRAYRSQIEGAADAGGLSRETLAHVRTCRACADTWRQGVSLRRALRELERVEAPADFEFRLRARMNGRGGTRRESFLGGFYRVKGFAPLAAAFCFLAISATLFFWHGRQTTTTPAPKEKSLASATNPAANNQASADETTAPSSTTNPPITFVAAAGQRTIDARGKAVVRHVRQPGFGLGASATGRTLILDSRPALVKNRLPVRIPVGTSAEPLRVILRDETGAAKVVPMRAVSFGSQELLARDGGVRQGSTASANEGVW